MAATLTSDDPDLPVHDNAEPVTVHGERGYVAPMPLFQAVSSPEWGHIVTWQENDGPVVEVAVRNSGPEAALALAERVTIDDDGRPTLPPDALGEQTAPIHEGAGLDPYLAFGEWTLQYQPPNLPERDDPRLLLISGFSGQAADLQTLRFWALSSSPETIRGHDGVEYVAWHPSNGPFGRAWEEAPGVIVQAVGLGVDAGTLAAVADSLQATDADGWRALKDKSVSAGCQ